MADSKVTALTAITAATTNASNAVLYVVDDVEADMMDKLIRITISNCKKCIYREYNNGGGHMSEFHTCTRYNLILNEKGHTLDEIHPDCRLPDVPVVEMDIDILLLPRSPDV